MVENGRLCKRDIIACVMSLKRENLKEKRCELSYYFPEEPSLFCFSVSISKKESFSSPHGTA